MVYQPPAGSRDLLPLDVAQKRWIETRLQQVFHRWGYHRIITSTLEHLDALMAGDAIQRSTVIQILEAETEALGLRPELTASIARAVATRMAGAIFPLRLYYNANVFRRPTAGSHNRQQEFFQAGVELLGIGGLLADVEVLMLVRDSLAALELQDCALILGEAGLTRSLLAAFPQPLQAQVRTAIAHLDRVGLETLPMAEELRDRALALMDLRGEPQQVLDQVEQMPLDQHQQAMVENLRALIHLLQSAPSPLPMVLDLSLIRTFDYYTGIVFEVVMSSDTHQTVLGQGGRYDQLLGLYHPQGQSQPGVGFSWQIEQLHQVLQASGQLPQKTQASDCLVVADSPEAYVAAIAYAQQRRSQQGVAAGGPTRIELELGNRDRPAIYDYARHRRIRQIAWVKSPEAIELEEVT